MEIWKDEEVAGFNPRTREGATSVKSITIARAEGFNPRTREGATGDTLEFLMADVVSIHAPVRVRQNCS